MAQTPNQAQEPGVGLGETIAWLTLAIGMWAYSIKFDIDTVAYKFGPVSWPRAALGAIVVLAIAQWLMAKVVANRGGVVTEDAYSRSANAESGALTWWRIIATFTVPLIYLALLPHTGYFVTTPLFLVAYMLVFRERSMKYVAITAIGLYVVSLAIFSKLLFVPLPTGNLPGFYDFSNWLLELISSI